MNNSIGLIKILAVFFALTAITKTAFSEDLSYKNAYGSFDRTILLGGSESSRSEVLGVVRYPKDLTHGPYPLVIFVHGKHPICYEDLSSAGNWFCSAGSSPMPSYQGYDYVADELASHGYIVVSISAVKALDSGHVVELIQHHLQLWGSFNSDPTNADFGGLFVGKVDMNNIGMMGHSMGGEGVAEYFVYNRAQSNSYQVHAVFELAPGNNTRPVIDKVALGVMLPYCDGDRANLPGIHYYDDSRYSSDNDAFAKHVFLVMGANHDFFNTVWASSAYLTAPDTGDDWSMHFFWGGHDNDPQCGLGNANNHRLTIQEQQQTGSALIGAFFRRYLGNEKQLFRSLTGDIALKIPATTSTPEKIIDVHASYHPPASNRLDINRLDNTLGSNLLGGNVSANGLSIYASCGGIDNSNNNLQCLANNPADQQPHTEPNGVSNKPALTQLKLGWSGDGGSYQNYLLSPALIATGQGRDIRGYDKLQFRAGVDFVASPTGQAQDFSIELNDGIHGPKSVRISDYSNALYYPPGNLTTSPYTGIGQPGVFLPKLLLNTVRIPMSVFAGLDLSHIQSIKFKFDQTAQGAVLLSDLMLTKDEWKPDLSPILDMMTE